MEYQTIISCTSELITTVSGDLIRLIGYLLAGRLISDNNFSELGNRDIKEADRAARLVELVQDKVMLDPENYLKFIHILEKDTTFNCDILRTPNEKYMLYSQGNVNNTFINANYHCEFSNCRN